MKNPFRPIAIALVSVLLVAACGQKGPLFLPGNPSELRPQPPEQGQEQPQDQNEDEDDRDDDEQTEPPG